MRVRLTAMLLISATGAMAQTPDPVSDTFAAPPLPFEVGEELVYKADLGRLGGSGRGTMRVGAVEYVRGRPVYVLHFELRGKVALFGVEDRTCSWFDPAERASLRFHKRERSPLSSYNEAVELYPERRQWVAAKDSGEMITDEPLDELSFIYFVRTLPLADGDEYTFDRHFYPERNPTTVRVVGRETVTVPAGDFQAVVVEMRVKDDRRYDGIGTVRIHLTDDDRRIPLRIESRMRNAGKTVLALESK
ncbi:MAG TPA: DUF3108 domain-containing protein [Gemmatimonadaceae bacterium]|nr:DUF3108 domain-containing protein [Gemmatimonadaceae bacterium]